MPAYRLTNSAGKKIGAVILDHHSLENEILLGHPGLKLDYSATAGSINHFILELIPPEKNEATT